MLPAADGLSTSSTTRAGLSSSPNLSPARELLEIDFASDYQFICPGHLSITVFRLFICSTKVRDRRSWRIEEPTP
jgi:hypothetical protein